MGSYLPIDLSRFRHSRQCRPFRSPGADSTALPPPPPHSALHLFYDAHHGIAGNVKMKFLRTRTTATLLPLPSTIISLSTPTTRRIVKAEGEGRATPLVVVCLPLVQRGSVHRGNEIRARGHISREHLNCDSNRRRSRERPRPSVLRIINARSR